MGIGAWTTIAELTRVRRRVVSVGSLRSWWAWPDEDRDGMLAVLGHAPGRVGAQDTVGRAKHRLRILTDFAFGV
jgi:hypothetical protein